MAGADKVLFHSIVAQAADGSLLVGRGIPDAWLGRSPISVDNFPSTDGRRLGVRITANGPSVSLTVDGHLPPGRILFELPAFVDDVAATSAGPPTRAQAPSPFPPAPVGWSSPFGECRP
jgi:hypothetical protein